MKTLAEKKKQETSQRQLLMITIALFAAAAFLILWSGYEIMAGSASYRWPMIEGKVAYSGTHMSARSSRESSLPPSYYPVVRYQYSAGGKSYTCDRISYGSDKVGVTKSEAQAVAGSYTSGKKVMVYYDPANPERATLERGFTMDAFMPMAGGIAFLAVAFICLKAYRRG